MNVFKIIVTKTEIPCTVLENMLIALNPYELVTKLLQFVTKHDEQCCPTHKYIRIGLMTDKIARSQTQRKRFKTTCFEMFHTIWQLLWNLLALPY